MLSYLKNDQNQVPATSAMNEGQESQTDQNASSANYVSCAQHGKSAKQGTIILVALFAVGAGILFWMIKKSSPATAEAAPDESTAQIEQALAQLNSYKTEVNGQMDTLLKRFHQNAEIGQVTANELKKNPFRREASASQKNYDQESSLLKQEAEVHRQAGRLQLWTITAQGDRSCCMINDKLLYVGQSIEGFEIVGIEPQRVLLKRDGFQVELKIQE